MYVNGSAKYFDNQTNVNTKSRFIAYDIRDLNGNLKTQSMLLILDYIWNRLSENRDKGRKTYIYFDEAHLLFQDEYSLDYLRMLWKRARKYGGVLTGITQNVEDLLKDDKSRSMLSNSEFLVLLKQNPTDAAKLQDISVFFNEKPNAQYGYALDMANETGGMVSTSFDNSSELILSHIYGNTEIKNSYRAIVATGYRRVTLNQSLQENYERYVQAPVANYSYQSVWDTDNDHVMDHEEIMFRSKDQFGIVTDTVKVDDNGNVDLYTFGEITSSLNNMIGNINERLFYVEKGLERYKATTGEAYLTDVNSLMNAKVLPIWSDPNLGDSDSDDIPDRLDGDSLVDDKFPIIYKDLINASVVDYSDITMPDLNCYICSASLERIAKYVDTASLSGFDKLGDYGISGETLSCLTDYYMFAYGEELDADYYVCQWAEYNSLKQRKVIRQAKEVRKYTGINFDEISAEYESYDFWCTCAENSQKWVDNVNKTDEKYLEIIDKVIDSIPTANAFIIEFTPTNADDEVLTSYNQVIKGVCHGIYSKTDIVTKAPAAALTVPKSVIENDYIYRKNFKEKYGIELPKYITILSYFWDSMTDDLFMQLDDIDTNLLSNTNGNRWEYIGELLSDFIFDAGSTELSSEISRQRKSKTPDNAKIEKIESKLDDMFSKREFEKGDGTFGISLSKENAETYPKARKKCGGVFDEMLSKLPEYANELTECANESKEAGKEEEDDLFEKYKETFLLYTPKYGASFIKLATVCRITPNPQAD